MLPQRNDASLRLPNGRWPKQPSVAFCRMLILQNVQASTVAAMDPILRAMVIGKRLESFLIFDQTAAGCILRKYNLKGHLRFICTL